MSDEKSQIETMRSDRSSSSIELRDRAERKAKKNRNWLVENEPERLTPMAMRALLSELHVHQIELEMQNAELRSAQVELETAKAQYFDLYNSAPVGYITISDKNLRVPSS